MARSHEMERVSSNGFEDNSQNLIPGQIVVEIPGLNGQDSVSSGIKKGRMSALIKKLHDEEKHIIATQGPGKMVLYVASSMGLIGVVAGGVYLRARKKRG